MKKFLLAALCLAFVFCCAFGVVACTPTPGDVDGPSQPVDPSDPTDPDDPVDPSGPHTHSFGEWTVTIPATCEAEGEEQRVCSGCGEVETRPIAALGHEYADGICTRCGEMQPLPPTDSSCFTFTELDDGSYAVAWNRTTELPREVVIPWEYDGKPVTQIASSAFEHCENLTSVTIPDSVTSIGEDAFFDCYSLTSVTIGDGVTSIGDDAFYRSESLTRVSITDIAAWCNIDFDGYDSNPLGYANNLYLNGQLVTDLVIPDSVTSIGGGAFAYCDSLTSVVFEEPDGWSAGSTAILSEDLADPATAAEYLVNMYWECIWTRE